MRKFLLLVMMTAALSAQERYAIQVISAENEASITKDFMAKISRLSLPHVQKQSGGKYKVFLGDFHSYEEACVHLYEVRNKVSRDAFIARKDDLSAPKPDTQHIAVMAEAKMLQPHSQEELPEKAAQAKEEKDAIAEEPFCRPTKKALREAEISAALSFYKSSSFYTFK